VIRNAIRVGKKDVVIKRSNLLESIAGILKREGFIENYQVIEDKKQGRIKLYLKYTEEGLPVMEQLKRISKPGRREHCRAEEVRSVKGGVGIALFSTNNGILTDKEAREQGVGGEILCQIW
jgi:small subunit ribosomal protein S8